MAKSADEKQLGRRIETIAMRPMGEASEVAEVIAFLIRDRSSYVAVRF